MSDFADKKRFVVDVRSLPAAFPTHRHEPEFWECLGRAIAAYGFLEEVLGKAIFAFTGMRRYDPAEVDAAYAAWRPTLERALADPLGRLIDAFGKAVHDNPEVKVEELDELLARLHEASSLRDVLCHGSWRSPDGHGRSLPLFVNRKGLAWDTPIGVAFLRQTRQAVAELACEVVTTVTLQGWQFPGSSGPGDAIVKA